MAAQFVCLFGLLLPLPSNLPSTLPSTLSPTLPSTLPSTLLLTSPQCSDLAISGQKCDAGAAKWSSFCFAGKMRRQECWVLSEMKTSQLCLCENTWTVALERKLKIHCIGLSQLQHQLFKPTPVQFWRMFGCFWCVRLCLVSSKLSCYIFLIDMECQDWEFSQFPKLPRWCVEINDAWYVWPYCHRRPHTFNMGRISYLTFRCSALCMNNSASQARLIWVRGARCEGPDLYLLIWNISIIESEWVYLKCSWFCGKVENIWTYKLSFHSVRQIS